MKVKTFFCKKLIDDGHTDYDLYPEYDENGELVDYTGKPLLTLVFKYCKNCMLIPDSKECIQFQRDINKQVRLVDKSGKYWIDWRNHPRYNTELTKDIPDNVSAEMLESMNDQELYDFAYYFNLKVTQTIRCSKPGEDVDLVIDKYQALVEEREKILNELKKREIIEGCESNTFVETQVQSVFGGMDERMLLKMCIYRAQGDLKMQFIDNVYDD